MRRAAAIVVLIAAVAAAPAARAGEAYSWPPPPPERPREAPADDRDFGWQVFLADVGGIAATLALAGSTSSGASLLPYLLAAPTVHALHGDALGTVGSLLLNAGVPAAGALVGWAITSRDCGPNDEVCGGGAVFGLILGVGAAVLLDAIWLSHPERTASKPGIQVTPTIDPRLLGLSLAGNF